MREKSKIQVDGTVLRLELFERLERFERPEPRALEL